MATLTYIHGDADGAGRGFGLACGRGASGRGARAVSVAATPSPFRLRIEENGARVAEVRKTRLRPAAGRRRASACM